MTYSMMRFAAYDQVKGLMHKGESSQAFSAIAINTSYAARGQLLACKPLPLPLPHAAARPDLSQNGFSRECAHRGHSSHPPGEAERPMPEFLIARLRACPCCGIAAMA